MATLPFDTSQLTPDQMQALNYYQGGDQGGDQGGGGLYSVSPAQASSASEGPPQQFGPPAPPPVPLGPAAKIQGIDPLEQRKAELSVPIGRGTPTPAPIADVGLGTPEDKKAVEAATLAPMGPPDTAPESHKEQPAAPTSGMAEPFSINDYEKGKTALSKDEVAALEHQKQLYDHMAATDALKQVYTTQHQVEIEKHRQDMLKWEQDAYQQQGKIRDFAYDAISKKMAAIPDVDVSKAFVGGHWGQALAAIFQGLGGFGAGMTHSRNFASDIVNSAVDRSVYAQKENIAKQWKQLTMDKDFAHDKYLENTFMVQKSGELRFALLDSMKNQISQQASTYDSQIAKDKAGVMIEDLSQKQDAIKAQDLENRLKVMKYTQSQAAAGASKQAAESEKVIERAQKIRDEAAKNGVDMPWEEAQKQALGERTGQTFPGTRQGYAKKSGAEEGGLKAVLNNLDALGENLITNGPQSLAGHYYNKGSNAITSPSVAGAIPFIGDKAKKAAEDAITQERALAATNGAITLAVKTSAQFRSLQPELQEEVIKPLLIKDSDIGHPELIRDALKNVKRTVGGELVIGEAKKDKPSGDSSEEKE